MYLKQNMLFKVFQLNKFKSLVFAGALLLLLLSGSATTAFALNDTTGSNSGTIDQLIAHCKDVLPKSSESACTTKLMTEARNVATYYCEGKSTQSDASSSSSMDSCILNKARSLVTKASQTSTTANGFTKALNNILDATGKDKSKPSASSQNGATPNTTCLADSCTDPALNCDANCDFIAKYVNPGINLLTASFGLIAVISLIIGGINYSTSEGDPQKTSRAKKRILNTIVAVVAYLFLYAFLNFLIPGGLFTK
ncbi:MAG: pilin [Candidatus Saccharimonadales bacterium]